MNEYDESYQAADASMLPDMMQFAAALAAGVGLAALVLLVFAWPWKKPTWRLHLGWPLTVGGSFLLAAYILTGRPHSFLGEDQDRLLAIVVPAAIVIELLISWRAAGFIPAGGQSVRRDKPGGSLFSWSLRLVLTLAIGRILLHGTSFLVDPTGLGLAAPQWTPLEALLWLGGAAAVLIAGWVSLTLVARKAPRATLVSLTLASSAAGIAILHEGYITGGKLAASLAAILLTLACVSWFLGLKPSVGAVSVSVVTLYSLLLMGHFFGTLRLQDAVVLFLAPLLCGLFELPWLRIQSNVMRGIVGVLLAALPPLLIVSPYFLDYNTRTVVFAVSLLGASSGIVGCFAVLRKRALTGDALAHAALPGVCIGYLIVRERNVIALLLGAFASGLAGVAVIALLRRWTRIKEDAAIGMVLGVFFGAGIFLLSLVQRMAGGGRAGLDSYILGKTASIIHEDVLLISLLAAATVLVVLLLYKEFKLVSFDADFAQTQGWPALSLDLLLMALVAVTVVVGLPAVGVVMMAALLIIPAAAARFWTDRLMVMIFLAAFAGAFMGVAGAWLSNTAGVPAGPAIILVGAAVFALSALLAPRRGLLARAFDQLGFQRELRRRSFLRVLHELSEPHLPELPRLSFGQILARKAWMPLELQRLLADAQGNGWIELQADNCRLTQAGAERAARAARGQRLWELFLREYPDLAQNYANLSIESVEEILPEDVVRDLEGKLLWKPDA